MNLIYPYVELWKEQDHTSHVAKCARVCYASESDSKESDARLVRSLEDKGHLSMFRHETRYYIIKKSEVGSELYKKIYDELRRYEHCPYLEYINYKGTTSITLNGDFYRNPIYNKLIKLINDYEVTPMKYENSEDGFNQMRYTFCVVTQISTSRELNRVSPNNIAEQSTRYVNFDKKGGITICLPHWWDNSSWFKKLIYKSYWKSCEIMYNLALRFGMKPQDAREFLPLCTASKCVYTYSVDEWQHILDLRYRGVTGKPHPNAKLIASYIAADLDDLGYNVYNK